MFNPTRDEVRQFFCAIWRKHRDGSVLTPLESVALGWIGRHPEYHALLERPMDAVAQDYSPARGQTNPFLHLSLHLALAEQLSIDQPPGIRALHARLAANLGDDHDAAHAAIECLAELLWHLQRETSAATPEHASARMAELNERYLDCLRAKAGASR